jgi:hypothetical protein
LNVNVHLNGGKTDKDRDIRTAQLKNLFKMRQENPFKDVQNMIVSGDFNTEISEVDDSLSQNL